MGTESRKIARLMLPDVKLVSEPRNAARNNRRNLVIGYEEICLSPTASDNVLTEVKIEKTATEPHDRTGSGRTWRRKKTYGRF
ncbi:hypothetical protein GCM10027341_21160 [Spirosoma knui]